MGMGVRVQVLEFKSCLCLPGVKFATRGGQKRGTWVPRTTFDWYGLCSNSSSPQCEIVQFSSVDSNKCEGPVDLTAQCGLFPERELFIDNLLVRIHLIVEMILLDRPCVMGV